MPVPASVLVNANLMATVSRSHSNSQKGNRICILKPAGSAKTCVKQALFFYSLILTQ